MPMDVTATECKLMEVKKFSAEYNGIDVKFRKPNLELICVYAVQNPFLYGMYELRREQMKMQQEKLGANLKTGLKERQFFYPTTFENLEAILRNNFNAVPNLDDNYKTHHSSQQKVKFYDSSEKANDAFEGTTNPRILIVSKILISLCHRLPEKSSKISQRKNHSGLTVDTLTDKDRSVFYKFNHNEMYPDHVLVYRDLEGPADAHTSRLTDFLTHCQISYRAGTRYNPQEQEFKGRNPSTTTTASVTSKNGDTSPKADDLEEIKVVPTKNKVETVVEFHAPERKSSKTKRKANAVVQFHAHEEKANEFELQPLTQTDSEVIENDSKVKNSDSQITDNDSEVKNNDSEVKNIDSEVKHNDSEVKNNDSEVRNNDPDSEVNTNESKVITNDPEVKNNDSEIKKLEVTSNDSEITKNKSEENHA